MTYAIEGTHRPLGSRGRPGSPRPGHQPGKLFSGAATAFRRRTEQPGQLRRRRLPRHAAGDQRANAWRRRCAPASA